MVYPKQQEEYVIVRTYQAFVDYIREKGLPEFISLNNDLGEDEHCNLIEDGYAAAK